MKTSETISVEKATPGRTVPTALAIVKSRRRQIASVRMMAASTISPAATAKPPSVITLTPRPSGGNSSTATGIVSAIEASTTRTVRTRKSVSTRTTTTTITASRTTRAPPSMDVPMKSAWR